MKERLVEDWLTRINERGFVVKDRELDDYTRTRNTVTLSAAACWQLIPNRDNPGASEFQSVLNLLVNHLERGRLYFWGEGALTQFLILIWMLERGGQPCRNVQTRGADGGNLGS
jgi:hypothetical protein